MPAEATDTSVHIVGAVQKVRRQKQRPTAERIRHMLARDGHSVSSSEVDEMLDAAVSSGAVERIYNTSGIVSYKETTSGISTVPTSKAPSDEVVEVSQPEPKTDDLQSKESKKSAAKKQPSSSSQSLQPNKLSHGTVFTNWSSHETISPDCKPTVVVDKHTDLSDVVLQVMLRLGCASGKSLEKNLRSHYRLDIYPGVDVRRHIRTACKALVRHEQLRQEGNNFVLTGDVDDVTDITLTVDEPTINVEKSGDDQEDLTGPSLFICSECKEIEEDPANVITCTDCGVGKHLKCMGSAARRQMFGSPRSLWLCYSCRPCTVCLVSGRTRKLRLGGMLVCDLCDHVYHPECCGQSAPRELSWVCSECLRSEADISECSSPTAKRRRTSSSAHRDIELHVETHDDAVPRTRMAAAATSLPTSDKSSTRDKVLPFHRMSIDRPTPSSVAVRSASSSEQSTSRDFSMHPRLARVTISPLRSVRLQPTRALDGRRKDREKVSASGPPSRSVDKSRDLSGPESGYTSADSAGRRRSRNIQLTSLFDSLTQFFSADSDRRRRTAYVNATISLAAQSSIVSPRQNAPSVPKPPKKQLAVEPAPWKLHERKFQDQKLPDRKSRFRKSHVRTAKQPPVAAAMKSENQCLRNRKSIKRPAESDTRVATIAPPTNGAEMKELKTASVAKSESKLFDTAQTIAQQRLLVTSGSLSQSPVVIFDKYEFLTSFLSPYSQDFAGFLRLYVCEFCFKCLTSGELLKRHQSKCLLRCPPGTEIYRRDSLSVFEVHGNTADQYCSNLGLFARLFITHESLYGCAVRQFTYYLLCSRDVSGSRLLGFFTKRVGGAENLSCLLVLPPHRGAGYTQLMITLSYHLCRLSLCVGSAHATMSDDLRAAHVFCWKSAVVEFLQKSRTSSLRVGLTVSDISQNTGISLDHVTLTLNLLRLASNKDTGMVDVSASKLKDCTRQFTLSRKLQATLDPALIQWHDNRSHATSPTHHRHQIGAATSRHDTLRTRQMHFTFRHQSPTDDDTDRTDEKSSPQRKTTAAYRTANRPVVQRISNIGSRASRVVASRLKNSRLQRQLKTVAPVRRGVRVGKVKKPLPPRGGPTRPGRSVRPRKLKPVAVGTRRSPRAHAQSIVNDKEFGESRDLERPLTAASKDNAATDDELSPINPLESPEKLDSPCLGTPEKDEHPSSDDDDGDADADAGGGEDSPAANQVLDMIQPDNEYDSATRSLSASVSPRDAPPGSSDAVFRWLPDPDAAVSPAAHNSVLFDANNSMSSEADTVDVVDDAAAARESSPVLELREHHVADDGANPEVQLTPESATVDYDAAVVKASQLRELEEFVERDTCRHTVPQSSGEVAADKRNTVGMSQPYPPPGNDLATGLHPPAASSASLTHLSDVRRGAMWRDSLFPPDFPPEPSRSQDPAKLPAAAPGKTGAVGKPDVGKVSSLDWQAGRQQPHLEILSPHPPADVQACRPDQPPPANPQYHYREAEKPAASDLAGGYRYSSGRRSVHDGFSRGGPLYDTTTGGTTSNQRAASVRPAVAASVDAQRLSHHVWAGTPLPAHQHHVSLSHLQHLVNDEFQYGAPAPATSHNPCQQPQPPRQHAGRQPHRSHHKQASSSSSSSLGAAGQPIHDPAASLAAAAAAQYDMFNACRIQQPITYFPHQGAAAALPMGVVGLHHAQMAVAAAANLAQPMPAGQAANSAMYSAAAAAAYSYLNGGGLQPFNVDINSVMRR